MRLIAASTLLLAAWLHASHAQENPTAPTAVPAEPGRVYSSAASVATTNSMEALDTKHRLQVGDVISYRVVEERSGPRQFLVTDSGEVELPLIGRVPASGKSCRQFALEVKGLLEKEYFYKATVIIGLDAVSTKSKGVVYMMGQVRNQGALDIPLSGDFTVSKAILKAGGFADFANQRKVKLVRKRGSGSETIVLDIAEVIKGNSGTDPVLQRDDVIIVPERAINF